MKLKKLLSRITPYLTGISVSFCLIPPMMYDRFMKYGYWAIGGEILLPMYAFIIVYLWDKLKTKWGERYDESKKTNSARQGN